MLDPEVVTQLMARRRRGNLLEELTPREHEVLEMIATGLDNQQIARRLVLSDKTVRNRVSDILSKLHARSRAEMVALARDAGLGGP